MRKAAVGALCALALAGILLAAGCSGGWGAALALG